MEERLKTYLRPGEQVRWQGTVPPPFRLLEAEASRPRSCSSGDRDRGAARRAAGRVSGQRPRRPAWALSAWWLLVAGGHPDLPRGGAPEPHGGAATGSPTKRAILLTRDQTFDDMELADIDGLPGSWAEPLEGKPAWFWAVFACSRRRPEAAPLAGLPPQGRHARAMTTRTGPWG